MASRMFPGQRFRRGAMPSMISHCASAAPIGCIRIMEEQLLLSAPLIIRDGGEKSGEQDIILELADFSFTPPEKIFADLQTRRPPKMDMPGIAMAAMKSKPDLNDVRYDAFLANGRTLADPEVTKVEPCGRVRVRIVNSSSMSAYHIDLGELDGTLVAVDGIPVLPVHGRTFPVAVAQRLDIELQIPKTAAAYPVLAMLEGERRQTGIVLLAGEGHARRISAMADAASPPLTLSLERSLRAAEPLADRKADRTTGPMVPQQCGLEQGCPAPKRRRGRKSGACARQSNHDAASHASAWSFLPNCLDRRHSFCRRRARYRAGASKNHRDRGFRCRQSGMVGFSLPPLVPSARGDVCNFTLRLNTLQNSSSVGVPQTCISPDSSLFQPKSATVWHFWQA
jgi:Multicopper oxidase